MDPAAYLEMAETENTHWWFTARRRILSSVIDGLGPVPQILEIGCGTGGNLAMLSKFGQVRALEMDPAARRIAMERTGADIRPALFPGENPFAGDAFDLICMFDMLEHAEDDLPVLAAARGMLAAKGRILVTVPAYRWMWSKHDDFLHHKRRYTAARLRAAAATAGLSCTRVTYFNTLLFPLAVAARLKDRLTHAQTASGTRVPGDAANRLLHTVFAAERGLLKRADLPFGLSLLAVMEEA